LEQEKKKKKQVIKKLKNKFRLVVINDDTFEERFSILLSPINVFTLTGLLVFLFTSAIVATIAFTPVREFIPGYSDISTKKMAAYAAFKADSLEVKLTVQKQYLDNIKKVLKGEPTNNFISTAENQDINYDTITIRKSKGDSMLRDEIEKQERFNLSPAFSRSQSNDIGSVFLIPPVDGEITSSFNSSIKHYGIDLASNNNEPVIATFEGTVTLSTWSVEDGNVIQLQHANDLISVYKHNAVLLKKPGDVVKAGEAIAIIGNSGENTTGPHLHFELWYKGSPIDPQKFILF
jgi:murein DD-endopeptidase MepM/ murein hydrolase activator NlpD